VSTGRILGLLGCAALLAGCGSSGSTAAGPDGNGNVTLSVRSVPGLGKVVVTAGRSLYMYPPDRQRRVTCTKVDGCESAWPPLFVSPGHHVIAGPGIVPRLIGTIRGDGGNIVTYNHWPLYFYIGDRTAGALNGQGQGFNWYVISPNGVSNKSEFPSRSG
jgi:predicted lipoprotein with Yx(FWY)xxD motif